MINLEVSKKYSLRPLFTHSGNPLEQAAQDYGSGRGGWWP